MASPTGLMYKVSVGEVPYAVALGWQDRLVAARQADEIDDVLLLLTHPAVYTAGRNADVEASVTGARPDIPVIRIDRGGDLTYHGPGQVVAYPIMRVPRTGAAKAYVTALEEALITTVASFGVTCDRRPGYTGVWVDGTPPEKIAAIGIRITRGVTKHGVALNVSPDMRDFDGIVPCGITDGGVTSLTELGARADIEGASARLGAALGRTLERTLQPVTVEDLGLSAV